MFYHSLFKNKTKQNKNKNNELWLWLCDRGVYLLSAASLLHDCAHEPGNMGKTLKDPNNGEFWEGHIQNE